MLNCSTTFRWWDERWKHNSSRFRTQMLMRLWSHLVYDDNILSERYVVVEAAILETLNQTWRKDLLLLWLMTYYDWIESHLLDLEHNFSLIFHAIRLRNEMKFSYLLNYSVDSIHPPTKIDSCCIESIFFSLIHLPVIYYLLIYPLLKFSTKSLPIFISNYGLRLCFRPT